MDEGIMVFSEQFTESIIFDTESSAIDTVDSENALESVIDSVDNSSNISDSDSANTSDIEESGEVLDEYFTGGYFNETYYNVELGGYPVVIVNDVSNNLAVVADNGDYYTTLSTVWIDYFSGVLANLDNCDYMVYCLRDYASNSSYNYIEHYVMFYDLQIDSNDMIVGGVEYPYIDIYRETNSSAYIRATGYDSIDVIPFPAYGSFSNMSDIREGVTVNVSGALLFAIGFAVVYSVCTHIFNFVLNLRKRNKSGR